MWLLLRGPAPVWKAGGQWSVIPEYKTTGKNSACLSFMSGREVLLGFSLYPSLPTYNPFLKAIRLGHANLE